MLRISKINIDGTRVTSPELQNFEFSALHPEFIVSWALESGADEGKQEWCEVVLTDKESGCRIYSSGRLFTAKQSITLESSLIAPEETVTISVKVGVCSFEAAAECDVFNASLGQTDGRWLTSPENRGNRVLRFGKTIFTDTKKEIKTARLYYCGLGYHEAYINGKKISDRRLDPAHSNYKKVCYYQVDNVADLISGGENLIEIKVAPGWRKNEAPFFHDALGGREIEFFGDSVLWAKLKIEYAGSSSAIFETDGSWTVGDAPEISEIYDGETFEADKNIPFGELDTVPAKVCEGPGGILRPMTLPSIYANRYFEPIEITYPKAGMFVVDFGQNIAGVVELKLKGLKKGQTITIRHSEELDEDGTLFTDTLRTAKQLDTYIASGDERDPEAFSPTFTYHGFRYCEVTGLDCLDRDSIRAVQIYTNVDKKSSFTCGSAILNAIQQNLIMTERDNMHSILTDCPQRDERMAWMNDATVRFEETPYNFDVSRFFPKICEDIRNEQRPEGQFTCCSPFVFGGLPADPVCSSYLMAGKGALYHCGETNTISEFFDAFAKWENFLLSRSPDGTVDYSYYGDWAAPGYACVGGDEGAVNAETEGKLMSTGYSYFNCVTLAEYARVLGRNEDEVYFTEKAEYVRKAFLDKWFDSEKCIVDRGSMGACAFALWLGIIPAEYEERVAENMRKDLADRNYRITTGNLNTRYLMDMLAKFGYTDDAYAVLTSEEYPGFGYEIQNEATTIWERFELKKSAGMNSHNHPMYGSVGSWFYKYLGGITPVEPGFAAVRIEPYFPTKLLSAHAVVDTVMGELSVRWAKRYGKLYLFVCIPFGMKADIRFAGNTYNVTGGYHVYETEWKQA